MLACVVVQALKLLPMVHVWLLDEISLEHHEIDALHEHNSSARSVIPDQQ
jgi:hypothetical protein